MWSLVTGIYEIEAPRLLLEGPKRRSLTSVTGLNAVWRYLLGHAVPTV